MITLKQVIHYPDSNSVEATWVDEDGIQIRCHSYADVQMDMLWTDFGADAADYAELIALVESNIQPPVPVVIPVPQIVTNYQGKVTLDFYQMYEEVEAYINLPDTPRAAKLAWATGSFERYGTMTLAIAANFGLSDEQMDNMFIYGKGVE